ncbi:MAG TPA: 16S rRNA (guanine(527)-N(7))-methyltransferase RsmG [bacterium]|nr:16S rRNA (guanine(527)-N(7))-methyltransferase RsmG [bacterium]
MFHVEHVLKKLFVNKDLPKIKGQLELLKEKYFKWNNVYNISSIRNENDFWIKHVLDSLCLAKYLSLDPKIKKIIDVGSGGGFPAIVLSMVLDSDVLALEPIKKKTDFIDYCSLKIGLKNLHTINSKFQNMRLDQDVVVSRALGMYNELCTHSFSQDKKPRVVIMTTNKNIKELSFEHVTIKDQYDEVSEFSLGKLEDHILCEVYSKKYN